MLIELNSKLLNESSKPFHSYLLISGSSRYLIDQAKAFSSNLLFNSNDILEHPDIRVVTSENINTSTHLFPLNITRSGSPGSGTKMASLRTATTSSETRTTTQNT